MHMHGVSTNIGDTYNFDNSMVMFVLKGRESRRDRYIVSHKRNSLEGKRVMLVSTWHDTLMV